MNKLTIHGLAALVIIGLGGYFFWQYGQKQYHAGYDGCKYDAAVLANQAGENLKNEKQKTYSSNDVRNLLFTNLWMRDESDR